MDTLSGAVAYKKKHRNTKIIHDCHEFYPYSFGNPPFWYSYVIKNLEKKLIKYVDLALTINPLMAKKMGSVYGKKFQSMLNATYYWHDLEAIPPKDFKISNKKINFLFQGTFHTQDALFKIIEAWEGISPANACFFLRGKDSQAKQILREKIKSFSSFNKSIFFIEPVSEENLIAAAIPFDVGVIAYEPIDYNYQFCCPNKLNQYMHAGLAIFASKTEFVGQYVKEKDIGLVFNSLSKEETKKCLIELINNDSLRNKMKEKSKFLARSEFNWQNEEKKY